MDAKDIKSVSPSSKKKSKMSTPLKTDDCHIQYGGVSSKKDDDVPLIDAEDKSNGQRWTLYQVLASLTIEPAMFGFSFAFVMILSVFSNMVMDKGCLFHLNYTSDVCGNLSHHDSEKKSVEILAANYTLYINLTNFIGAFMMIFIAPWSDKYGRRLPLLVACFGAVLTDVGLILCTYYYDSRLEYLILTRLPSEFTGGFICMLTFVFSHASEVSTERNRTLKYTAIEIALGLGMAFGSLTGGFVYGRYHSYLYVYLIVAVVHALSFLWVLLFVQETTGLDSVASWTEKAGGFFSCESMKAGMRATFKRREGYTRAILVLLLLSMCAIMLNYEALGSISYLYVHHVYNWDPSAFSVVMTTSMLLGLACTLLLVPLFVRVLRVADWALGIMGTVSMMAKTILIGFAVHHTYLYYTGLAVGLFTSMCTLSLRTSISKLVAKDELGCVFSFLAICESTLPMLGMMAFTQIFKATIDSFPNVSYMTGAALLLLPLGTFIWSSKVTKPILNVPSLSSDDKKNEKV